MSKASDILEQALQLRVASDQGRVKLSALEDEIVPRCQEAARLAPSDPDVLFLAAYLMGPYCPVNRSVAKDVRKLYKKLDKLGGPGNFGLQVIGGQAAYQRERARRV